MTRIKYDASLMKQMAYFGRFTKAKLKDTFVDPAGLLTFVVEQGEIGKAIGKNGANARTMAEKLNRKIKIVEFNSDPKLFVRNLLLPVVPEEISVEDGVVQLTPPDLKTRGLMIGRGGQNLRSFESTLKRYFNISEVKVK